jgi:hypothetical protein
MLDIIARCGLSRKVCSALGTSIEIFSPVFYGKNNSLMRRCTSALSCSLIYKSVASLPSRVKKMAPQKYSALRNIRAMREIQQHPHFTMQRHFTDDGRTITLPIDAS